MAMRGRKVSESTPQVKSTYHRRYTGSGLQKILLAMLVIL